MGKKKRMKRLFPRQYSAAYVKTSRIDPMKSAAYNAMRSRATIGSGDGVLPNLDNNFMSEVPRTRSLSTYDNEARVWVRSVRGVTVDRKHQVLEVQAQGLIKMFQLWVGSRGSGLKEFFSRTVEEYPGYKLELLFSGNEFMYVSTVSAKNIRRISRIYNGREEAMAHRERIAWIIEEPLKP